MKGKAFLAILTVCFLLMGSITVLAEEESYWQTDNTYLYDQSQTLSAADYEKLKQLIQDTANHTHNNVAVRINEDSTAEKDARTFCDFSALNLFDNDDGTIALFVSHDCSVVDIAMDGAGLKYYSYDIKYSLQQDIPLTKNAVEMVTRFCKLVLAEKETYYDSDDKQKFRYGTTTSYYDYAYYQDNNVYYCDESEQLTKEERQKIVSLLEETSSTLGFRLALYTAGENRTDEEVEAFADTGSRTVFGESPENGVVFLYVDMDGYSNAYDYMYCYHEPFLYYTSERFGNRIDKILVSMQKHFPSGGNYMEFSALYAGLQEYCRQLVYYKEQGPEPYCYYYLANADLYRVVNYNGTISETKQQPRNPYKNWWKMLLIGSGLGVCAGFFIFFSVKQKYRFKTSVSASAYTSYNHIHIRKTEDTFLGTHVSRVYIEPHHSHSGGGHSSSHSGGGHSGGGGGGRHR